MADTLTTGIAGRATARQDLTEALQAASAALDMLSDLIHATPHGFATEDDHQLGVVASGMLMEGADLIDPMNLLNSQERSSLAAALFEQARLIVAALARLEADMAPCLRPVVEQIERAARLADPSGVHHG